MSKKGSKDTADISPSSGSNYDPEPYFTLMDLYFERDNQVLIEHQINSFNQFVDEIIPSIITSGENVIGEKASEDKKTIVRDRLVFEDYGPRPAMLENDEGYMYPHDALQKKLSYTNPYVATISQYRDIIDVSTGKKTTKLIDKPDKDVPFAKIYTMVKAKTCNHVLKPDSSKKHCKYDAGGYFIVGGSEKVILSVESIIDRKPMVFVKKDQNSFVYYVQVRSRPSTQFVGNVQTFSIKIKKDKSIVLEYKPFKEISVFTLMRALGLESDKEIIRSILDENKEKEMLNFMNIVFNTQSNTGTNVPLTTEASIETLLQNLRSKIYSGSDPELQQQQRRTHLMKMLSQYILPHVVSGTNDPRIDMMHKAYYIGYMIHKLLKCYLKGTKDIEETRGCDDRDAMYNKRIDLPGILLGSVFEQSFKKMLNDCQKIFKQKIKDDKNPPVIISSIKHNTIEQGLRKALSQGVFGSQMRKGLSQMFSRLNHSHSASYLRRIISPTVDASTNKMTAPRHLHVTQFNKVCPLESPEGPKTGLMKHLALMATVTIASNSQIKIITELIKKFVVVIQNMNKNFLHDYVQVFLNGTPVGYTKDAIKMHHLLRDRRFKGEIEKRVSLIFDYKQKEYKIYTEGGRLVTPYLTVNMKTNTLNFEPSMLEGIITWDEFMEKHPYAIEFLDSEEELYMMLATFPYEIDRQRAIMNRSAPKSVDDINVINRTNRYDGHVFERYTHCMIHPCTMLGTITSNIPFTNHNAPVRGIYGYNQQKQAMGLYISDYRERCDISYILYHTQVPVVASRASKYTGTHVFPAGENIIVAIASYDGWNQEDSIIMNSTAIDTGLFRAQSYKKYQEEVKKNPATSQPGFFTKPDPNKVDLKIANYSKLSPEGYVDVEVQVKDGDALITMVNPKASPGPNEKPYTDSSTIYKSIVPGAVDRVFTGYSGDGYQIIKLRVRSERIPIMGDKFSCYDDKTEVLTDKGWIFFKDLTKEHRVATLFEDTLVYDYPNHITKEKYNGKMYSIQSNQVDLCVTPNHRMWVAPRSKNTRGAYKIERADNLMNKVAFYQKNAKGNQTDWFILDGKGTRYHGDGFKITKDSIIFDARDNCPRLKMDLSDWLIFFGIWMAEGYVKDNWATSISAHKPRVKVELERIRRKYDLTLYKAKTNDGERNQWNYPHKGIKHVLNPLSVGAINKYLPEWVWELDGQYPRDLIHGMLLGDGHPMKGTTTKRYDTSSIKLANDFQRLCLHAGWSANLYHKGFPGETRMINGNLATTNADAWRLTVIETQNNPKVNKHNKKKTTKQDKWVDYDGYVYCCSVDSGIIYVRRNGVPVFSGNSYSGQKGTCGLKLRRSKMPYTEYGLQPDAIINPNCINKRMTVAQLLEGLMGKMCAYKGIQGDGTPFMGVDIHSINDELVKLGGSEWGNDVMYSGTTGLKMDTKIFITPTYYQRLKQMVGDKVHSRAGNGPKQLLTRQPTEGRARDGGFRLGEMERDVFVAHGAAAFLKERTVDCSDMYICSVCDICGRKAHRVKDKKQYTCPACVNTTRISEVVIPYALSLLFDELMAMNILPRIRTTKSINVPKI